jgi:molybdopterin molybdotransferase
VVGKAITDPPVSGPEEPGGATLAGHLTSVLQRIVPLRPLDLHLDEARGGVLAEDVSAPAGVPAFDAAAVDGYAVRAADLCDATAEEPVLLSVLGDLTASSWRPTRITPGVCYAVATGTPMPGEADAVIPTAWTDGARTTVTVPAPIAAGTYVRRAGQEVEAGALLGTSGTVVQPALVAMLAAAGLNHVVVRPRPRVLVLVTGDELVESGNRSAPGQVADANSHALAAAAADGGAQPYRVGPVADDGERLRSLLDDHRGRCDMIITSGGTGTGPSDVLRRVLGKAGVEFVTLPVHPTPVLGFGLVGPDEVPTVCLPGDPGAALIGFEVLARPVLQRLAGAEPVFRPSVRGMLSESIASPRGLREFRPALVTERRGGGYTVLPLSGPPHLLGGLVQANGLVVLGERTSMAPAGSSVDVVLFDRRR